MTKSPPSEELIQQLADYDLAVGELALGLRAIVLEEAPAAIETIYRSYALALWYSFSGRMSESFCYIGVSRSHVNLGFYRGAELDDPDGIMEGSGKQMRHIKVRRPEDLKNPHLCRFVRKSLKHTKSVAAAKLAASPRSPTARATAKKRRPTK